MRRAFVYAFADGIMASRLLACTSGIHSFTLPSTNPAYECLWKALAWVCSGHTVFGSDLVFNLTWAVFGILWSNTNYYFYHKKFKVFVVNKWSSFWVTQPIHQLKQNHRCTELVGLSTQLPTRQSSSSGRMEQNRRFTRCCYNLVTARLILWRPISSTFLSTWAAIHGRPLDGHGTLFLTQLAQPASLGQECDLWIWLTWLLRRSVGYRCFLQCFLFPKFDNYLDTLIRITLFCMIRINNSRGDQCFCFQN